MKTIEQRLEALIDTPTRIEVTVQDLSGPIIAKAGTLTQKENCLAGKKYCVKDFNGSQLTFTVDELLELSIVKQVWRKGE